MKKTIYGAHRIAVGNTDPAQLATKVPFLEHKCCEGCGGSGVQLVTIVMVIVITTVTKRTVFCCEGIC